MMKKFKLCLLILLTVCTLVSCKSKKPGGSDKNESNLPVQSQEFIDAVNGIVLTLDSDSRKAIEDAYALYDALDEESWDFDEVLDAYYALSDLEERYYQLLNYDAQADDFINKVVNIPSLLSLEDEYLVIAARNAYNGMSEDARLMLGVEIAYNKLVKCETKITELKDQIDTGKDEEDALVFINQCMKLKDVAFITLEDEEIIDECFRIYETLSDTARQLDNVKVSYEKLLACKERYDYLVLHPEISDNIKIDEFVSYVEQLPNPITLEDIYLIKMAELSYEKLKETLKENDRVVTAYEELVVARSAYNLLYVEKLEEEKAQQLLKECNEFIALVNEIPETITVSDGAKIKEALEKYRNLSKEAKESATVIVAYNKLVEYANTFDGFNLEKIKIKLYNILPSSGANSNVVLQGANALLYPELRTKYGVSSNDMLVEKCNLILVVYSASNTNTPLFEVNINETMKNGSEDIIASTVLSYFINASVSNPNVVSGQFKLGLKILDKTGGFKDSDIYKSAVTFTYNFTSNYQDPDASKDVIYVSSKEEFLNIKNNLNGHYELTNDIDLSDVEWVNMGILTGVLDGRGHAITGLNCSKGPDSAFGLFLEIAPGAKVCNLKVTGDVKNAGTFAGLIAVRNYGLIKNCYLNVRMTSLGVTDENGQNSGDACIGGIVTENFGTIANVIVTSYIEGAGTQYGMLDGAFCVGNYGSITNCYALKDNLANQVAIGNDAQDAQNMNQYLKSYDELTNARLYEGFDRDVWEIVDGFIPEIKCFIQ